MKAWIITMAVGMVTNGCILAVNPVLHSTNVRVVTTWEYDRIAKGMDYNRIRRLIGADGTLETRNSFQDGTVRDVYIWKNKDGSWARVYFVDDKVTEKNQNNLFENLEKEGK